MLRIILSIMLFFGCLSANFFIVDNGIVMEIVNEPSTTNIVDSNGKTLKKHKSLYSANQSLKERQHPKKVKKVRKSTKKSSYRYKRYKKQRVKKSSKRGYKKRYISKKKSTKRYKKKARYKYSKKKRAKTKDYIVIKTAKRRLYHYKNGRLNRVYKIAVGKRKHQHFGTYRISRKKRWPDWIPTKNIKKEFPKLPNIVKGGKNNPLGARALYLGHSSYRIHGTNKPNSIGKAASHGCFRMRNRDVIALYNKTVIGTKVYVK
jgi:lipoprotein-anchoring transpeptidase ErfK/SrfK